MSDPNSDNQIPAKEGNASENEGIQAKASGSVFVTEDMMVSVY